MHIDVYRGSDAFSTNKQKRYKMKKWVLQLAVVFAMTGFCVQAQVSVLKTEAVTMAATVSNATKTVTLGGIIDRSSIAFATVDRIAVVNGSATNAVITFYAVDPCGAETSMAVTDTIAAGGEAVLWPEKSVTRTVIENLVTNGVVTGATVTNTVTEYKAWTARDVKISIQQEIGTAAASVYKFTVYAK